MGRGEKRGLRQRKIRRRYFNFRKLSADANNLSADPSYSAAFIDKDQNRHRLFLSTHATVRRDAGVFLQFSALHSRTWTRHEGPARLNLVNERWAVGGCHSPTIRTTLLAFVLIFAAALIDRIR